MQQGCNRVIVIRQRYSNPFAVKTRGDFKNRGGFRRFSSATDVVPNYHGRKTTFKTQI